MSRILIVQVKRCCITVNNVNDDVLSFSIDRVMGVTISSFKPECHGGACWLIDNFTILHPIHHQDDGVKERRSLVVKTCVVNMDKCKGDYTIHITCTLIVYRWTT